MKKWTVILCGMLVVQLVLAVVTHLSGEEYGAFKAEKKLLVFDVDTVDHLQIDDGTNNVTLIKQAENWVLPEHNDFLADQRNVAQLLDKLVTMEKGWPVATTPGAARRFKVAEDEFESKLTLLAENESLAQLYIGTSPGLRKTHARNAGSDEVFAVVFNAWEASANSDDWIDKNILTFAAEDLMQVEMPDFILQREDDELQLTDLADQEEINRQETHMLANSLSGLQIDSLLDDEGKSEDLPDDADFTLKVTLGPDETLTYHFFKLNEEAYYLLKRSDFDDYLKIAEFHVNALKETTRNKLLQTNV